MTREIDKFFKELHKEAEHVPLFGWVRLVDVRIQEPFGNPRSFGELVIQSEKDGFHIRLDAKLGVKRTEGNRHYEYTPKKDIKLIEDALRAAFPRASFSEAAVSNNPGFILSGVTALDITKALEKSGLFTKEPAHYTRRERGDGSEPDSLAEGRKRGRPSAILD